MAGGDHLQIAREAACGWMQMRTFLDSVRFGPQFDDLARRPHDERAVGAVRETATNMPCKLLFVQCANP